MKINLKRYKFSSLRLFSLVIVLLFAKLASAQDCDPFALDPNDPYFCDGSENPDDLSGPLDEDLGYLSVAGTFMAAAVLKGGRRVSLEGEEMIFLDLT